MQQQIAVTYEDIYIYIHIHFKTPTSIHVVANSEKRCSDKTPRATENTNGQWSWINNQNVMTLWAVFFVPSMAHTK